MGKIKWLWIRIIVIYLVFGCFLNLMFDFLMKRKEIWGYCFNFLIFVFIIMISKDILSRKRKFYRWLYYGSVFFSLLCLSVLISILFLKKPQKSLLEASIDFLYYFILFIYLRIPRVKEQFK